MSSLQEYLGKPVVIDTRGDYLFLGTLTAENDDCLTINDVDVHDHRTTTTSKDVYVIEAVKYGIKPNRHQVKVLCREVVSISLLEHIILY